MGLKERLLEFINYKGIDKALFERSVGFSNGFVDKSGDNTRSSSLDKISNTYPELNISWLRTGEGGMLRESSLESYNTSSKIGSTNGTRKRLSELIKSKGETLKDISDRTNISEQFINELLHGHDAVDIGLLFKVIKPYGNVSLKWLLKGEGDVYSEDLREQDERIPDVNRQRQNVNYKLLPIINLDIVGGNNNVEADTAEYIMGYIPFVEAREGDVCCFISGNSMTPLYPAGVAVQIRKVELWLDFVEFGNVYVLDLIDGRRLIKEIRKGKNEDCFTLHSFNVDYEDVPVPKRIIRSVWQVIQKLEKVTMW